MAKISKELRKAQIGLNNAHNEMKLYAADHNNNSNIESEQETAVKKAFDAMKALYDDKEHQDQKRLIVFYVKGVLQNAKREGCETYDIYKDMQQWHRKKAAEIPAENEQKSIESTKKSEEMAQELTADGTDEIRDDNASRENNRFRLKKGHIIGVGGSVAGLAGAGLLLATSILFSAVPIVIGAAMLSASIVLIAGAIAAGVYLSRDGSNASQPLVSAELMVMKAKSRPDAENTIAILTQTTTNLTSERDL